MKYRYISETLITITPWIGGSVTAATEAGEQAGCSVSSQTDRPTLTALVEEQIHSMKQFEPTNPFIPVEK